MLYSVEFSAMLRNVVFLLKGVEKIKTKSFFFEELISSSLWAEDPELFNPKSSVPVSNNCIELPYSKSPRKSQ